MCRRQHPYGRKWRWTKKLLYESERAALKFHIQKKKIMASSPFTSWQIVGETMETVTDFIFLGSKITEDGDCNREIKRWLFLRRKAMTNLDSIFKTFFPRSKCLLISWLQSPSTMILEPRKIKSATISTVSPYISHEVMGPDAMIFIFWMLSFKQIGRASCMERV